MLKRVTIISLILMYSVSAIGMPLHYHYCKGQLQHVTILTKKACEDVHAERVNPIPCCLGQEKQACDPTSASNSCCDDRSDWITADENQVVVALSSFENPVEFETPVQVIPTELIEHHADFLSPNAHAPPVQERSYLVFCALIVYG